MAATPKQGRLSWREEEAANVCRVCGVGCGVRGVGCRWEGGPEGAAK